MAQVYALMHDGNGDFMIAFKNILGYFFHNPSGSGTIIPGGARLNGGGNWTLPGGKLEAVDPLQGALNEFLEETGTRLDAKQASPFYMRGKGFYGVYFNLGGNFNPTLAAVGMNIELGNQAAAAIKAGTYGTGQYDALMTAFAGCPADNELNSAYAWNLRGEIQEINRLGLEPSTDWFLEILTNLALETYGVIVTDANELLAGIGSSVAITEANQYEVKVFTEDPSRLLPQGNYTIVSKTATYRGLNFVSLDAGIATFSRH